MLLKNAHKIFFTTMLSITTIFVYAQEQKIINANNFITANHQPLQEKIFAHTDKDFYVDGEILWFKLYDVSSDSLKPLNLSHVAYVEILNAQQKPVLQAKVELNNGSGNGSLYLPSSIISGNYIFRAYTNWMKNFSADSYFQKIITIVNTLTPVTKNAGKDSDDYEINFFPEGGNFISGIESRVGFKVTDKYGTGINCSGTIVDENNQPKISFTTLKFGMGSFYFTPEQNHTYKALLNINGKNFTTPLPHVYNNGYVMRVSTAGEKQVNIAIHSNINFKTTIYLLAYSKKNILLALEEVTDENGNASFIINKNSLQPGIVHMVLFTANKQPVCERLIFIRPQLMQLNITADKSEYTTRSEVNMNIKTASNSANLSMAVYLVDSLQGDDENNILNYLWLTSELKGRIESPQYYFKNDGVNTDAALDNLLLTQGWSRFKREDTVTNNETFFHYAPEHGGHIIEGKVIDKNSGLPAANVRVYLSVPGEHFCFATCTSNDTGAVFFDIKDFYGAGELVVQTEIQDSMYRVEIANPFSGDISSWQLPAFNFSPGNLSALNQHSLAMQVQNAYSINQLNTFNVPSIDSNAFYGLPDTKYFLDNYVRFNTMEEVLREYVYEVNVKIRKGDYSLSVLDQRNHQIFKTNPLVLVDGVPIFNMNKVIAYNPHKIKKAEVVTRKYYLNSYPAYGIVSYSTYKGDLDGFPFEPATIELPYDGIQLQREFYSPKYATASERQSRVPDYRNVLYWMPQINSAPDAQISFFTSDVKGKYITVVQGLDKNGNAGYSTTEFEVK
jgi:hypothetical protein